MSIKMPRTAHKPQITSGVYALLSNAWVYQLSQNLMGIQRLRQRLIEDHIQPEPANHILDIGCGPAGILAHLPATVHYTGYDLNLAYIESAQRRFGARGEFCNQRFDEKILITAAKKYDRIIAIGFLHHIDDESARQFFQATHQLLNPGGKVITIDVCIGERQPWFIRTLVSLDRGRHVRTPENYLRLAEGAFSNIRQVFRDDMLFIPQHFIVQECVL
jgi:cyclopropane fatty-acyl-phospholipid synthase-like methyltransferase